MLGPKGGKSRASTQVGKGTSKTENSSGFPIVRDPEDGVNRTPRVLLPGAHQVPAKQLAGIFSTLNDENASAATGSDAGDGYLGSFPSIGQLSAVGSMTPSLSEAGEDDSVQRPVFPFVDKGEEHKVASPPRIAEQVVIQAKERFSQKDLTAIHSIVLQETDCSFLCDKVGLAFNLEGEESSVIEAQNNAYEEMLKRKVGNDAYISVDVQTVDNMTVLRKHKEVHTSHEVTANSSAQWDVDALLDVNIAANGASGALTPAPKMTLVPRDDLHAASMAPTGGISGIGSTLASLQLSASKITDVSNAAVSASTSEGNSRIPQVLQPIAQAAHELDQAVAEVDPLSQLPDLEEALSMMDHLLMQNVYLDQMLVYCGMDPLADMLGDFNLPRHIDVVTPHTIGDQRDAPVNACNEEGLDDSLLKDAFTAEAGADTLPGLSPNHTNSQTPCMSQSAVSATDATLVAPQSMGLQLLWQWSCNLTKGRNVSCMAWNHERRDLLAVGYGSFVCQKHQGGLVCIWSMRNPSYPLWWFELESGITSLDFSKAGGVLAVGTYSGNVVVCDVKARSSEPVITSDGSPGKHSDPVWAVKWLDTGTLTPMLVTTSTDGRVTRWNITKGFEFDDLMKLKRTVRRDPLHITPKMSNLARNLKQEAFISRLTGGTTFDFSKQDERVYIAGTEDGYIHRCSTSYSEQYMMSYSGHMGPVYNLQWCPFQHNLFISCSADWTVRLWSSEHSSPLLTFQNNNDEVYDVQWCPTNSTIFATATKGGSMEVWDFSVSTVKPIFVYSKSGVSMTCVLFNKYNSTVVAGDSGGSISVLRLFGTRLEGITDEEHKANLAAAMDANVMKTAGQADAK
jgi:WD40 repeat protein